MRLWIVICQQARLRGAIGAFYPIAQEIEAPTRDAALAIYRERVETAGPPTIAYDAEKIRGAAHAPGVSDRYR